MKGREAVPRAKSGREAGNLRKLVVGICRPQHPTRDPGLSGGGSLTGREGRLTLAAPVWYSRIWPLAEPLCNREGERGGSESGPWTAGVNRGTEVRWPGDSEETCKRMRDNTGTRGRTGGRARQKRRKRVRPGVVTLGWHKRPEGTYLDVRICCTCWGVRAKVKCASSNRWLEVDAEDGKGRLFPSPHEGSHRSCPHPGLLTPQD